MARHRRPLGKGARVMPTFLNSPIANSAHPDANPAEGVMRLPPAPVVTVETRTVTTQKVEAVSVTCPTCILGDFNILTTYPADAQNVIFDAQGAVGIIRVQLSLADAEAYADGINALVRQMRRDQQEADKK